MAIQFFGQSLLSEGLIHSAQLDAAVIELEETNVAIGALAVRAGLLRPEAVVERQSR
jgi:hypothetical protein